MRYKIELSAYVYADTDEEAFEKVNEMRRAIDTEDNKPQVRELYELIPHFRYTRDVWGDYLSYCTKDF